MARPKSARRNVKTTVTTTTTRGPTKRSSRRNVVRRGRQNARASTTTTVVSTRPTNTRSRSGRSRPKRMRRDVPGAITTTVTATLGTVGANSGKQVETELIMMMNPALTKETTGSNQFGPVQMYASTYAQWTVSRVHVKATPLVGASAVSGTVARISLNMTGAPTSSSWSALGARPHVDVTPGRTAVLRLSKRHFPGPKEGWYNCNTKGDPNMAIGGSIEVHTLGQTMSTYKNEPFTGGLFLLEMTAVWKFRNYEPQPGLLNMIKGSEDLGQGELKIKATEGQPIELQVPPTSRLALATQQTTSEIIWQIVDTAISAGTSAFPPPFNWLFKGGWWFIKKVANAPVSNGAPAAATYRVYASIQDARADVPCLASTTTEVDLAGQNLQFQQITPGNTGMGEEQQVMQTRAMTDSEFHSAGALWNIYDQGSDKTQTFFAASHHCTNMMTPETLGSTQIWWPSEGIGFVPQGGTLVDGVSTCDIWEYRGAFYQEGYQIEPAMLPNQIPVYAFYKEGSTQQQRQIGYAVGAAQLSSANNGYIIQVLFYSTQDTQVAMKFGGLNSTDQVISYHWNRFLTASNSTASSDISYKVTTTGAWGAMRFQRFVFQFNLAHVNLQAGHYYVLSFGAWRGAQKVKLAGRFPIYVNTQNPSTQMPDDEAWLQNLNQVEPYSGLDASGASIFWKTFPANTVVPASSRSVLTHLEETLRELEIDDFDPDDESEADLLISDDTDYDTDNGNDLDDGERRRPPTPKPGPDGYSKPPTLVLEKLTKKGRELYQQLTANGVPGDVARAAAQESDPHPAYVGWRVAYHNALLDGLSPPTARSLAWKEACDAFESRGHAE
uniref:Capsid protein n=1 Tax=Niviventer sp. astrovirus TaxID=3028508 RepID=A0AAT9TT26_9VIRU|nr:MAG: capsid protein [Niviventer sp. astrovirus]